MMSTSKGDIIPDQCAACGKGGDGLKTCVACKMVKYCGVSCQKSHRPRHKKECKKRAVELHEEALFRQPAMEDCPICFLPISCGVVDANYKSCCGKTLCGGCVYVTDKELVRENRIRSSQHRAPLPACCPFCRAPLPSKDAQWIERIQKRMEHGDADAYVSLGRAYMEGSHGLPRDEGRGFGLWLEGSKIGSAEAHNCVGLAYFEGRGVRSDEKKAFHFMELAAMEGDSVSRHNLGTREARERNNIKRAIRHWIVSAGAGNDESLDTIKKLFMMGHASKADYETALRAHKGAVDEMRSKQRDEAAAALTTEEQGLSAVRYR